MLAMHSDTTMWSKDMVTSQAEAVRNYLVSLRDPAALKDEARIAELQRELEQTDDELRRVQVRQQIIDAEQPPTDRYEQDFVTHAKAWADEHGITDQAFLGEGVPPQVLRRAGFKRVQVDKRRRSSRSSESRQRVRSEDVRAALPSGTFTVKAIEDATGASAAVVRRVINEEVERGAVTELGSDPDHSGPGRAPKLFRH